MAGKQELLRLIAYMLGPVCYGQSWIMLICMRQNITDYNMAWRTNTFCFWYKSLPLYEYYVLESTDIVNVMFTWCSIQGLALHFVAFKGGNHKKKTIKRTPSFEDIVTTIIWRKSSKKIRQIYCTKTIIHSCRIHRIQIYFEL